MTTLASSRLIDTGSWSGGWHTYAFFDQPRSTCLSDGTYLVALAMEDAYSGQSLCRLYHIDADLAELGHTDINGPDDSFTTYSDLDRFFGPQVIATGGNHALMVSSVYEYHAPGDTDNYVRTWGLYPIDCTSAAPTATAPVIMTTAYGGPPRIELAYHLGSNILYDAATDRVLVSVLGNKWMPDFGAPHGTTTVTVLQAFQASTGVLLSETSSGTNEQYYPIGLWMNPADHTKFSVLQRGSPASSNLPFYQHFTVATDGLSGSYDGVLTFPNSNDVSGGRSPYDGSSGGIVDSGCLFDTSFTQLTADPMAGRSIWSPASVATQHGDFLDTYVDYTDAGIYNGMFVRINLATLVTTTVDLPYASLTGASNFTTSGYAYRGIKPCFNPVTGDVVVFNSVQRSVSPNEQKVMAWKIAPEATSAGWTTGFIS